MIVFKLDEIPAGDSVRHLDIPADKLELAELDLHKVMLHIDFHKTENSLRIHFQVEADARLVCDRSLEPFDQVLKGEYQMVYDVKVSEESEGEQETVRRLDVSQNRIDIGKEVRDTLLLSVPVKKLHPRFYDEKGVPSDYSESFPKKEFEDPRWDALKKLKKNK